MVEKKLKGFNPTLLSYQELEHAMPAEAQKDGRLKLLKELILGPRDSLRRTLTKDTQMSTDKIVDCLLEMATDGSILRCAFAGWSPMS